MANLLDLLMGTRGGWNPDVQQTGVRPGYGLGTTTGVERPVRSPYQRTLDPGETRTPSQLQEMLAEVILAAGSAAVPGVGPKGVKRIKSPRSQSVWSTKSTNDLHPELDKTAIAQKAGIPQSVQSRRRPEDPLFHFTSVDALAEIAKSGLRPAKSGRVKAARPGVYLADSAPILSSVDRDVPTQDWALLRVRPGPSLGRLIRDKEYEAQDRGAWIGRKEIPPESIDVWSGKEWLPIRSGETPK